MIDYYAEFNLDRTLKNEEICQQLKKEKRKWQNRLSAPDLERRQLAEKKCNEIEEAYVIFSDELKRKEYDRKLAKEGQPAQAQQVPQPQFDQSARYSKQQVIQEIINVYNSGNTQATIDICHRYLNLGMHFSEIYLYLGFAYWDNGDLNEALAAFKNGFNIDPNDDRFYSNIASMYLNESHDPNAAHPYLQKAIQLNPNSAFNMALLIYELLLEGREQEADRSVENYLANNPQDMNYRAYVADTYIKYANKYYSTADSGASYIDNKENYEKILSLAQKAHAIIANDHTNSYLTQVEGYGKKKFYKGSIGGIVILALLGMGFIDKNNFIIPGLMLVGAVLLIIFDIVPDWQITKMDVSGKKTPAPLIASIIGAIVKYIFFFIISILGACVS